MNRGLRQILRKAPMKIYSLQTSRIRPKNRYKYDFQFQDGFFQKQMTSYEQKKMPIPMPSNKTHKAFPIQNYYPSHWNDVRYNYKPQNYDRRMHPQDFQPPLYDFANDANHTVGHIDQDFDGQLPDPVGNMHFNRTRSPFLGIAGALVALAVYYGYFSLGMRYPQRQNQFYFRKKFANMGALGQEFQFADMAGKEEFGTFDLSPKVFRGGANYHISGDGLRYTLPTYDDHWC